MGLFDEGKVIIEVGLNESVSKEHNPHIPYGPDEVANDAVACARAGAAVVHYHARTDDGANAWIDSGLYRQANEAIARECDLITYPTYLGSYDHIWDLDDRPPAGAPLVMAPFDVPQGAGTVFWDDRAGDFVVPAMPGVTSSKPAHPVELAEMRRRGISPTIALFDVGHARWAVLATRAGIIDAPLNFKLFLSAVSVTGPFPTAAGIDAYLSQIPADFDTEITCVPFGLSRPDDCETLWRASLERKLHVRVGIGDNPAAYPTARNAELVERAVELIDGFGLRPAVPADVSARLKLKAGAPARA